MERMRRLKVGALILAMGSLSLSAASGAMLAQRPDVATDTGSLLCAGALANLSLSLLWALIAVFPLRRGERWAFWAYSLPIPLYGIPMLILDGTHVSRGHLLSTLGPQVVGLVVATLGLSLVGPLRSSDRRWNGGQARTRGRVALAGSRDGSSWESGRFFS